MKKYYLRYLFFWVPAVLIACFFNNASMISQVLQWFFASFMVLGWTINTAMAAYTFPRRTLSTLLVYAGVMLLIIVGLYNYAFDPASSRILQQLNSSFPGLNTGLLFRRLGGLLSFTPLDIFVQALLDFAIPHEIYITLFLVGACLIGWICGLVYRFIRPNPYRPKIVK